MPAIQSINPATEELLGTFAEATPEEVEAALTQTDAAFRSWRFSSFAERSAAMQRGAAHLRAKRDRFAALMTAEMGKPILEAEAEVEKCAWACDYFAEHAAALLADEPIETSARWSYVAFEPLGAVLAIMPWNFPFWQVFRFAAPALMAGNAAILKHAPNVPQCELAIEEVFREAGFPPGIFRNLRLPIGLVPSVIEDGRVCAVTLTGSVGAGSQVAAVAGRAIKKSVMELGGSDPFIVLPDADLELAAQSAARARNQNSGQSCIAAKRMIVVDEIAGAFEQRFVEAVSALRMGDPMQRETNVGPLARRDLRDNLARQVERSVQQGARVVLGGQQPEGRGYYYTPTILDRVTPEMPAFREETFGPLAAVIYAKDPEHAITLANDSAYGLGASLWTRDLDLARRLAPKLEAGSVFVNGIVASDPRLPFGGIKRSGYGRELSTFGLREFVNIKTLVLNDASGTAVRVERGAA
ncbi:MAG TPA: NAD-dependent succinate-semialdehyde dehydrogenase [Steroidobacteraceae bacterium]|nr:NAD-dependent succinate-semialdehyde dehydrogenase [Steroidobacteraceae bacterium]